MTSKITEPSVRIFQVLSYVTGINLLLLTAWCLNKYVLKVDLPSWTDLIGVFHGWFFLAYAASVLKLAIDRRWSRNKTLFTIAAGTIPVCSFIAERRRMSEMDGGK